jgi:LysM repeat protein
LNKIAQKTGVSKQKLMALNNIENEAFIMAGQRLKLTGDARSASNTPSRTSRPSPPPEPAPQPRPTRQPEAERPSPSPTSGRILFYYVKPGENLQAISRRTGVPVDTLKRLNNINESTVLTVGQRLRLQ